MRRLILAGAALLATLAADAQGPRVWRSEFLTYDKREDAAADKRDATTGDRKSVV